MHSITMNKVRDHRRDRSRRAAAQSLPAEEEALDPALVSGERTPDAAIAELPASMRTTILMRSNDRMRYA
ncbi:MAG: hypothetical protein AAF957_13355, partial [Planctomycetota bacterium]